VGSETRWQRSGQILNDFLCENLNFLHENLNFLYANLRFSLSKILMISSMIYLTIHKISYYRDRVSTGSVETRWLGGSFFMVYRDNTGRLGSGFISVCLETRWLGQNSGLYLPERPCTVGWRLVWCWCAISLCEVVLRARSLFFKVGLRARSLSLLIRKRNLWEEVLCLGCAPS